MSPHGEEAYKDLIYLNDAYKRAIIDSQGQEESLWDRAFVKDVITECVDRGRRCSVVSLYPHIEVVIACTRAFVKDVIVTECVDRGRRCSVISLYSHINIVITYNLRQRL